jgi:hypothetical protein
MHFIEIRAFLGHSMRDDGIPRTSAHPASESYPLPAVRHDPQGNGADRAFGPDSQATRRARGSIRLARGGI